MSSATSELKNVKWTPEYLAGLFDGEGCFMLQFNKNSLALEIKLQVSIELAYARLLSEYLKSIGMCSHVRTSENMQGTSTQVGLHKLDDIERFIGIIEEHLILKRRQLQLAREAIRLKRLYFGQNGLHYDELNEIRHRMHSLSHKGPRTLKEYR